MGIIRHEPFIYVILEKEDTYLAPYFIGQYFTNQQPNLETHLMPDGLALLHLSFRDEKAGT